MSGGTIRILWNRENSAVVNIYGTAGQIASGFTVNGSPVTFPYTLTADKSFVTTAGDTYSVSVKLNDIEIAANPDALKVVPLFGTECTFAPSPDDGFVSPTGETGNDDGGGGDDGRGTLYLKLLGTNIDVSTSGDNALDVEIDTDRSTGIPDWISETDGVYSITEQGFYLAQIAGSGTCTYASTPASVGIDIYDNALSGVNLGWYSDGSDDSPSFTPAQVNDLQFLCKDTNDIGSSASFPLVLDPVVANNGVEAANTRVTISALLSITKIGSGPRYTEADLA